MKHLFTLSLVFFSLSHLAQAQRAEVVDVLSTRYCEDNIDCPQTIQQQNFKKHQIPGLLNQGELSLSGVLSVSQKIQPLVTPVYIRINRVLQRNPRNNIP